MLEGRTYPHLEAMRYRLRLLQTLVCVTSHVITPAQVCKLGVVAVGVGAAVFYGVLRVCWCVVVCVDVCWRALVCVRLLVRFFLLVMFFFFLSLLVVFFLAFFFLALLDFFFSLEPLFSCPSIGMAGRGAVAGSCGEGALGGRVGSELRGVTGAGEGGAAGFAHAGGNFL